MGAPGGRNLSFYTETPYAKSRKNKIRQIRGAIARHMMVPERLLALLSAGWLALYLGPERL